MNSYILLQLLLIAPLIIFSMSFYDTQLLNAQCYILVSSKFKIRIFIKFGQEVISR